MKKLFKTRFVLIRIEIGIRKIRMNCGVQLELWMSVDDGFFGNSSIQATENRPRNISVTGASSWRLNLLFLWKKFPSRNILLEGNLSHEKYTGDTGGRHSLIYLIGSILKHRY